MTAVIPTGPTRHVALGPHDLAQRVPCSICRVPTGSPCLDPAGSERIDPHNSRWIRYQHLMRRRPFTATVVHRSDPRVQIGDLLLCVGTPRGGVLRVVADNSGGQERPEFIDSRDVEFRAFVEESPRRGNRHQMRRRPGYVGAP